MSPVHDRLGRRRSSVRACLPRTRHRKRAWRLLVKGVAVGHVAPPRAGLIH
ncbi:MAG: hypothetical protein EPN41_11345 [Candidimonas sp.]|nr:MAG: hypothetical protein EPN41_11345 [Candidimonas sp.]